jgi:6-phosphogluconolactonase
MTHHRLDVFDNVEAITTAVLDAFVKLANNTIAERGVFRVSLSGGSTPKRLYQALANQPLDWSCIEWYWGDERNVPHDHSESNFRMVKEAMLQPAKVPASQYFPVPVSSGDPATVAANYEATLKARFGGQQDLSAAMPAWDLVLLGMGDDAHTASLFPETNALNEQERWFVENWVEKFKAFRFTLTAPAINSGREIWFLVTGENKRDSLAKVLGDERNPSAYPSQLIRPTRWYVTADACGQTTDA